MMRKPWSSIACVVFLTVACSESGQRLFRLPTTPSDTPAPPGPPVSPAPVPGRPSPPPVRTPSPSDVNPLEVEQTFSAVVGANPPECLHPQQPPGWPCQYFRLVPPAEGRLTLTLTYGRHTQPGQAVDVSIREGGQSEIWADFASASEARLTTRVSAGSVYEITLWYTFPGLAYELRATIES
jgi:hypothetical protein